MNTTAGQNGTHEHDAEHSHEQFMEAQYLKIIALFACLAAGLVGLLVLLVRDPNSRKKTMLLHFLMAFSAGVFLSMSVVHLLPEGVEALHELSSYPLGGIFCGMGALMMVFVEHVVVHKLLKRTHVQHETPDSEDDWNREKPEGSVGEADVELQDRARHRVDSTMSTAELVEHSSSQRKDSDDDIKAPTSLAAHIQATEPVGSSSKSEGADMADDGHNHDMTAHITSILFKSPKRVRFHYVFALLMISLHAFATGLALGAITSSTTISAFIPALVIHKVIESIALSSQCVRSQPTKLFLISTVGCFSLVTPLGIGVGMAVSSFNPSEVAELISAIVACFSSGILLYVAIVDSQHVFAKKRWRAFIVFCLGFLIISLFPLIEPADHGH